MTLSDAILTMIKGYPVTRLIWPKNWRIVAWRNPDTGWFNWYRNEEPGKDTHGKIEEPWWPTADDAAANDWVRYDEPVAKAAKANEMEQLTTRLACKRVVVMEDGKAFVGDTHWEGPILVMENARTVSYSGSDGIGEIARKGPLAGELYGTIEFPMNSVVMAIHCSDKW